MGSMLLSLFLQHIFYYNFFFSFLVKYMQGREMKPYYKLIFYLLSYVLSWFIVMCTLDDILFLGYIDILFILSYNLGYTRERKVSTFIE